MGKYSKCPYCGNEKNGDGIRSCNSCGTSFCPSCAKGNLFSTKCPSCGGSSNRSLGRIGY